MNIEFDDGESGFWEARTLYDMALHYVAKSQQAGDDSRAWINVASKSRLDGSASFEIGQASCEIGQ